MTTSSSGATNSASQGSSAGQTATGATTEPTSSDDDPGDVRIDVGSPTGDTDVTPMGTCADRGDCTHKIDLLFVVDNSESMGEEQLNLAKNFPGLIQQLQALEADSGKPTDVNIMVTTTDMGGAWCQPFAPMVYNPARGQPVATGCNARIGDFEVRDKLGAVTLDRREACTTECATDKVPTGPFLHFVGTTEDNVTDGTPAEALSCIGPQGINGCGFESTLESMMQALNVQACWNDPSRPGCSTDPRYMGLTEGFLRPDALLAIVLITDEADCSVADFSVIVDPNHPFQEINPKDGRKSPTSAMCWNAGVVCDGPDGNGLYSNCRSSNETMLHPTSRYIDYLKGYFVDQLQRKVVMLGILGIPLVTRHSDAPPYEPTGGGVRGLVYRQWVDGEYPSGDILPNDVEAGLDAAYKEFLFGVGPGCTGEAAVTNDCSSTADCDPGFQCAGGKCTKFTGQAIPPVRIKEVCESLNIPDDPKTKANEAEVRCCMESICDTDFTAAIKCLTGVISRAAVPPV